MLTRSLLRTFVPGLSDTPSPEERGAVGRLEAWVSVGINTVLAAVKGWLGMVIGSIALVADAVHSLSDVATSIVVLFGFKIAGKPADKEHPFGHGRAEYVATLIIAVMLGVVGFEFIKSAVGRIAAPLPISAGGGVLAVIGLTIVIKFWLGAFSQTLGRAIDSAMLKADAWHHKSDAISSGLVLVAVAGSAWGYPALDGAGGIAVGLYMMATGYKLAKAVIDPLLGAPPSPELVKQIRDICRGEPRVYDAHDIVVHNYGQYQFFGLHVEVDNQLSAAEGHDIAESVASRLKAALGAYATVHIDPLDHDSDAVQQVAARLDDLLEQSETFAGYHDLRVVDTPEHRAILLDIDVEAPDHKGKRQATRKWLKRELRQSFPDSEINIELSPLHAYH